MVLVNSNELCRGFCPFFWIFTLVYIDDIFFVYSRTFKDDLRHCDAMLNAVAASGLMLSHPTCHLGYCSIVMLGHKVSRLGLSMHHEKLRAIWELDAPKDRKKLETFLRMAVYFTAYIPYFSWTATSLFKCLQKVDEGFEWTERQQEAFKLIKLALISAPI
jgi:hypothetical protein